MTIARYGWQPDIPDHRDLSYAVAKPLLLPPVVDLRPKMPDIYDQGQLGSCTANAIAAAVQYSRRRQGFLNDFVPSRLFIYYNERKMEGTIESDAGAQIRDGIKSVGHLGDCAETEWPYIESAFNIEPGAGCYSAAVKYRALDYWRVPRIMTQMKGCLAAGFPFVFGFSVYESFESAAVADGGVVPMPQSSEAMVGGHAVLAVGYIEATQRFIVRNSWGDGWGDKGYFYLPYAFLMDPSLSDDFWTVKAEAA
jgi:C1A family cysteine protease